MKYVINFFLFFMLTFANCSTTNDYLFLYPILNENGNYGFINDKGEVIIDCKYKVVYPFSENLAAVQDTSTSLFGYINKTGSWFIKPIYLSAFSFSDGRALIMDSLGTYYFIDIYENRILKDTFKLGASKYSEGILGVQSGKETHHLFFDTLGQISFEVNLRNCLGFSNGLVTCWEDSTYYLNKEGEIVIQLEGVGHGTFSEGLANIVLDGDRHVYIDTNGKVQIELSNFRNWIHFGFSEGLAEIGVAARNECGYINKKGEFVIPLNYKKCNKFNSGLAMVMFQNGKWGFIDKNNNTVIQPVYKKANSFNKNLAKVLKDGKWVYINKKGQTIYVFP